MVCVCRTLSELRLVFQLAGLPSFVKVVEVGPRDGLQNEAVSDFNPLTL